MNRRGFIGTLVALGAGMGLGWNRKVQTGNVIGCEGHYENGRIFIMRRFTGTIDADFVEQWNDGVIGKDIMRACCCDGECKFLGSDDLTTKYGGFDA
jgi:hypothetical protein